jgi:hypothetical protein
MKANPGYSSKREAASHKSLGVALAVFLAAAVGFVLHAAPAPQTASQQTNGEIVATLATGHVVWCVTKDAILVAALGGGGEQGSHLPVILPISSFRVGVLLGAMDWNQGSVGKSVRLDAELPQVTSNATRRPAPTQKDLSSPNDLSDIEQIGVGVLEMLRPLVGQLHRKLDLAPNEPLVELLLADYVENYGPEIWSLQFRIQQQTLGSDYWDTRILRPSYYQLYPPEKGSARTFMEVQYPPSLPTLGLVERLAQNDPSVERIRSDSPVAEQAMAAIADGHSDKALAEPVSDFLRTILPTVTDAQAGFILAKLDARQGFQWLLPPTEAPPPPAQTKPSEPGAPSLRKYIPPPK